MSQRVILIASWLGCPTRGKSGEGYGYVAIFCIMSGRMLTARRDSDIQACPLRMTTCVVQMPFSERRATSSWREIAWELPHCARPAGWQQSVCQGPQAITNAAVWEFLFSYTWDVTHIQDNSLCISLVQGMKRSIRNQKASMTNKHPLRPSAKKQKQHSPRGRRWRLYCRTIKAYFLCCFPSVVTLSVTPERCCGTPGGWWDAIHHKTSGFLRRSVSRLHEDFQSPSADQTGNQAPCRGRETLWTKPPAFPITCPVISISLNPMRRTWPASELQKTPICGKVQSPHVLHQGTDLEPRWDKFFNDCGDHVEAWYVTCALR